MCEWLNMLWPREETQEVAWKGRHRGQPLFSLLSTQYSLAPLPAQASLSLPVQLQLTSTEFYWTLASPESSTLAIQPPGVKGWGPTVH